MYKVPLGLRYLLFKIYICCSVLIVNNETDVTPKFIVFYPTATYKLLAYTDVLHYNCYGMTPFVDVRLARLTSHADSVRTLPSEMSNRLGLASLLLI